MPGLELEFVFISVALIGVSILLTALHFKTKVDIIKISLKTEKREKETYKEALESLQSKDGEEKKEEKKEEKPILVRNKIEVFFYDEEKDPFSLTSTSKFILEKAKPYEHFKEFVLWYHYRPQSDIFCFRYKNGSTTIKRKDIKRFFIGTEEVGTWRR